MEVKLYNTLTRKKEIFVPIAKGRALIYTCGPTVYKYAHAGNMRAYIFADTLVRTLSYFGYKVKQVMNITDVGHLLSDADEGEDKLNKSAREQQKSPLEIAQIVTEAFIADTKRLNITPPAVMPKATDNIPEMITITKDLLDKGYAYETSDGIYYDISKFPRYGQLSGISLEDQLSGARVEVNSEKRHPADFALWKKTQPNHIMQWDSPWGRGFPGWHIECTAMSKKFLGNVFDIHTGGVDHIPIHHENEIAQSEAWLGCKTTNYWLHNEWMLYEGGKMSKSLGNGYTITDFAQMGYSPMDFRYLCLNTHYRTKLNFSFEALAGAKTAYSRLRLSIAAHKESAKPADKELLKSYKEQFEEAAADDLNVPMALGVMHKMIKEEKSCDIYLLAVEMDKIFGLRLDEVFQKEEEKLMLPQEVEELLAARFEARKNKNYALSDQLRDAIAQKGYAVKDTPKGQEVEKI